MKMLIISSDKATTTSLASHCIALGYSFHSDVSGLIALSLPDRNEFDMIVVDDCAPYLQGHEVVRHLRRRNVRKPIILLSQHASAGTRRVAQEAGADIVLAKPVTADEIDGHADVLLNPQDRSRSANCVRVGELDIDQGARTVARGNRCVRLTRTQIRLLWALAECADTVVPREYLYASLWKVGGDRVASTLTSMVAEVRRRLLLLGADTAIETVRGVGYMVRDKS
ncbi:MAG: response regulator transcription factor [Candidatus Eremiobacteraeota bacterium]|nr:response regulator transcription factor [Candidatus Eremiobacteraeota bacterium]